MGVLFIWIGSKIGLAPATITGNNISMTSQLDTLTQLDFVRNPYYEGQVVWRLTDEFVNLR